MAHPYRVGDVGDAGRGTLGGLAVARRRQHLVDGADQRLGGQRPNQPPTALARHPVGDLPLIPAAGNHHQRHTGQQRLGHHSVPAAADHQVGMRQQFVLASQPGHRPRRHRQIRTVQPRHHHPCADGQTGSGHQAVQGGLGHPLRPGQRRRRRDHHHRPGARWDRQHVARSARSAADPPGRLRPASPGAGPPGRAAWRSAGAAARDRWRANRSRRGPPRADVYRRARIARSAPASRRPATGP